MYILNVNRILWHISFEYSTQRLPIFVLHSFCLVAILATLREKGNARAMNEAAYCSADAGTVV